MWNTNGSTIWARKTLDSDIFFHKPAVWFKIWFFLINRANWQDTEKYKRGECLTSYDEISYRTKASKNEISHCLQWLKRSDEKSDRPPMIKATRKATGGLLITVLKFAEYQDAIKRKSNSKSDRKATALPVEKRHYNINNKKEKKEREKEALTLHPEITPPEEVKATVQEDVKQWGEFPPSIRKKIFELYWKFISVNATSGKILIGNPADIALKKALLSFSPFDISLAIIGFSLDNWHKDKNHRRPPVWFFSNDKILGECFGYFYSTLNTSDQETYIKYVEGVLNGTTIIN
jgi:hypothetical protein